MILVELAKGVACQPPAPVQSPITCTSTIAYFGARGAPPIRWRTVELSHPRMQKKKQSIFLRPIVKNNASVKTLDGTPSIRPNSKPSTIHDKLSVFWQQRVGPCSINKILVATSWLQPCDCPLLGTLALPPPSSFAAVRCEGIDEAVVQPGRLPLPELDARGPKPEATPAHG